MVSLVIAVLKIPFWKGSRRSLSKKIKYNLLNITFFVTSNLLKFLCCFPKNLPFYIHKYDTSFIIWIPRELLGLWTTVRGITLKFQPISCDFLPHTCDTTRRGVWQALGRSIVSFWLMSDACKSSSSSLKLQRVVARLTILIALLTPLRFDCEPALAYPLFHNSFPSIHILPIFQKETWTFYAVIYL